MGESIIKQQNLEKKKGDRSRAKQDQKLRSGAGVTQPNANPCGSCGSVIITFCGCLAF